ncbi:MAG: glycosyltransferase family 4 protein [Candidatus Paceibacteria bacterium]
MKIAMIGQKGIPAHHGGVETHVEQLSKKLAEKDHQINVYSRKWYIRQAEQKGPPEQENISRIFTPTINSKHLDTIIHTFTSTVHALFTDVDIIHYHGVGPSLLAWIPRVFSFSSVVSTFHCVDRKHGKWGWFARQILKLGEWASCSFPHRTIAVSKSIQKYAQDEWSKDITYIPNGVPLFEQTDNTEEIEKWDLEPDQYLLIVSRLIAHKGIHYAIKAYKQIKAHTELVENKKLVIVGSGHHSSDYEDKIRQMAEEEDDIILAGFQSGDTLDQLFSHAEIMVSPSDHEGLPVTLLEAMSYSLPVVLSDIPEHKEVIKDSEYLFSAGDADDLEKTLKNILNKSKQKLREIGAKNRKIIEQNYSWNTVSESIEKLYKELQN